MTRVWTYAGPDSVSPPQAVDVLAWNEGYAVVIGTEPGPLMTYRPSLVRFHELTIFDEYEPPYVSVFRQPPVPG